MIYLHKHLTWMSPIIPLLLSLNWKVNTDTMQLWCFTPYRVVPWWVYWGTDGICWPRKLDSNLPPLSFCGLIGSPLLTNKVVIQCHDCKWLHTTESTATKQHPCTKKKIYFNRIWNFNYAPHCIYTVLIWEYSLTIQHIFVDIQTHSVHTSKKGVFWTSINHITLQGPLLVYYKYGKED
jgi:hypothetical protein